MSKKDSGAFTKSIIVFVLMIMFFVSIIIIYFRMLSNATKEKIIRECELSAEASSGKIDKYLSGGIDCVNITEGSLNTMIRERRTSADILDYLTSQSKAVKSVLQEATTGMYGYINGVYLDGDGWVPDEGYDPVSRPWYIQAKANMGKIVVVDPYLDAQTGQMITTLAKELCDAKSVVAVDLSLKELQQITEEITGEHETIMILDRDYYVIAHSDRTQINRDYNGGDDSLGNAIVKAYRSAEGESFRAIYNKTEYIVYSQKLDNNWICLCATDTTEAYGALRKPMILTVIVSVIVICFMIVFLVYSDKRRRRNIELEEKTQVAVAANNAKTAFLANMSHEIRTPINAILGMNEMVLRESEDEDILTYSRNIKNAGNTLLGIINDVLDFSRIESGKIDIIPVEYELSSVIGDLVNMIKGHAEEKGLKLVLDFDGDTPNGLFGDEMRIKQIITNLLTNAVKYTKKGTVTFGIRYEDDPADPDSIMLKVFVKDTGAGIRSEDMDKLTAKFERLEEKKNRNIEGAGLGLSITENLLELMGSTLLVESEYGRGSVFSFAVSQKVIDRDKLKDHEIGYRAETGGDQKKEETFAAPMAEILVVDDNLMNLDVLRRLLKRTLVKTDTADSGEEGIARSAEKKYDMIFLDHMMPGKDGIEVLSEIRADKDNPNNDTPVICLTANAISGAKEFYVGAGFNDYLSKPVDPDDLEGMMMKYLPEDKVTHVKADKRKIFDEDSITEELGALKDTAIDTAAGIEYSGSPKDYLALLRVFCDAADSRGEELEKLFSERDFETYKIKIHALKSTLRLIGATLLGDKAQELESACKNKDYDRIISDHGQFMTEFVSLKGSLKSVLKKDDSADEDKPAADDAVLTAIYDKMHTAADEMDCDRLEELIKELDRFTIPEEHIKRMELLREAVRNFEYETVLSILDDDVKA